MKTKEHRPIAGQVSREGEAGELARACRGPRQSMGRASPHTRQTFTRRPRSAAASGECGSMLVRASAVPLQDFAIFGGYKKRYFLTNPDSKPIRCLPIRSASARTSQPRLPPTVKRVGTLPLPLAALCQKGGQTWEQLAAAARTRHPRLPPRAMRVWTLPLPLAAPGPAPAPPAPQPPQDRLKAP